MRRVFCLLSFLLLASAIETRGEETFPEGTSHHEATEGRAAFTLVVPKVLPDKDVPLFVALHEMGVSDAERAEGFTPFAERARYILLCPRAGGLAFRDADLDRLLAAIRDVKGALPVGPVHLYGSGDSGYQALRYAFTKPREFRAVATLGADAPRIRIRGGGSLRALVMKGAEDRPAAGRLSLEAVREDLELAEFREVPGEGLKLDSPTLSYLQYFLDASSGRTPEGPDRNLAWRDAARGMAERNRRKIPALIYFEDDSPEYAARTEKIRLKVLMDPNVRKAAAGAVPILAPRAEAEALIPDAKLQPGPAIAVLDAEGELAGVLQRKITAGGIVTLLESR